jgi:hypothetical protein
MIRIGGVIRSRIVVIPGCHNWICEVYRSWQAVLRRQLSTPLRCFEEKEFEDSGIVDGGLELGNCTTPERLCTRGADLLQALRAMKTKAMNERQELSVLEFRLVSAESYKVHKCRMIAAL